MVWENHGKSLKIRLLLDVFCRDGALLKQVLTCRALLRIGRTPTSSICHALAVIGGIGAGGKGGLTCSPYFTSHQAISSHIKLFLL